MLTIFAVDLQKCRMADYINMKLNAPEEDLGYLIWRVTKFWQRGKLRLLEEYGLTGSQMEIMVTTYKLNNTGEEVSQIRLSQETEIDPMTVSTILRNLQKKGLVTRKESQVDTRARVVDLTTEGKELCEKAFEKICKGQELLFQNIDEEAMKKQLKILLDELVRLQD